MTSDSGGHTTVTPLPPSVTAEDAISFLHDHARMIELNPLVINHEPAGPALNAPQEQVEQFCWYLITDAVSYLPGQSAVKTDVAYKAAYQNRPNGLRTYTYAPGGIDISSTWTVEEGVTKSGGRLYLKECVGLAGDDPIVSFITRNSDRTHAALVDAILSKMQEDSHRKALIQEILMTERSVRKGLVEAQDRPVLPSRPSKSTRGPRLSIVVPPPRLSSEALCARGRHGPDCPHNFVATHGAIDAYSPGFIASPANQTPVFKTPVYSVLPLNPKVLGSSIDPPVITAPAKTLTSNVLPVKTPRTARTPGIKTPLSSRKAALSPYGQVNSREHPPVVKHAAPAGPPAFLNRLGSADRVMTMRNVPPPIPRAASSDKVPTLFRSAIKPNTPRTSAIVKAVTPRSPAVTLEPPPTIDGPGAETVVGLVPASPAPAKTAIVSSHPAMARPMLDRTAACDKVPVLVELPAADLLTMKPLPPIIPDEAVATLPPVVRKPVPPPLIRVDSAEYTPKLQSTHRVNRNSSSEKTPTSLHNNSPRLNPEEVAKIFAAYSPVAEHPCFCEQDDSHDSDCPFYDSDTTSSSNEDSSPATPPRRHAELASVPTGDGLIFRSTDLKPLPLQIKSSLRRQKKQPTKSLTIFVPPVPEYLQE